MERDDLTRSLFKGGLILFLGLVIDLGISFVGKLLIARYLGRVDYGTVSLGASFLSFSSMVLLLGLDNGVGRYLPRYDADTEYAERRATILVGLGITLPVSIAVTALVILSRDWFATTVFRAPDAGPVLAIFAVGIPFAVAFRYALGIVKGYQWSVPKTILQNILKPIVRFGAIALGIAFGLDATGMSVAYILPFIVAVAASLYWLRRTALFKPAEYRPSAVDYMGLTRRLLSFSVPLIITTVMMQVLTDIDRFFLSYYQTTGAVGVYSVIYPLAQLLTVGLSAFSFIFMPMLSELHADGDRDEMRRMYQVATKWIAFTSIPIGTLLVLFPEQVIRYTFGAEYAAGAIALAVLAVGFFTHAVVGLNGAALTSIGRTKTLAFINVVTAVVNVGLNLVLIPRYSYLGAAIATAVAYTGMNLAYSWRLYRLTNIHPVSRALLQPGIVSIGYFAVLYLSLTEVFSTTVLWTAAHLVAAATGYLVIILRFGGIEEEEVVITNSIEERFGIDLTQVKRVAQRFLG